MASSGFPAGGTSGKAPRDFSLWPEPQKPSLLDQGWGGATGILRSQACLGGVQLCKQIFWAIQDPRPMLGAQFVPNSYCVSVCSTKIDYL